MADVKDLLIRMSLDTSTFKRNIQDAKSTLRTLKSEYKAVASSDDIGKAGANLLKNLQDQKTAAEALVAEYSKGIDALEKQLQNAKPGSQQASRMEQQLQALEKGLADARTQVNNLQTDIDNVKLDNFVSKAETVASTFSSLRLGLGDLLNGFGDAADSADSAFVSRESARVAGTKSFAATEEQLKALDDTVKQLIANDLPVLYEKMYAILDEAAKNGVAIEDADKFATVMAKLATATNLAADTGSETMAQFINLTEKSYNHIDNIGSALVALGNNSATSEAAIMEMAHRAASGLSQVGMSAADILGVSAAISSMGIESQAGGTAISKLAKQMDEAAKVGSESTQMLLDAAPAAWGKFDSIYDLYAFLDNQPTSTGWKTMYASLGMTAADTKALMNSALAAERFSQAMGMTVDQFAAGWNENAANQLLNFFSSLGSMGGTDMEDNMLWTMDKLGITEVRTSNMVRSLSNNWQVYAAAIALANEAYAENVAMDEEAQRAFSTTESQRVLNANKEQNALEAMGETVTALRTPFDNFFADVKQGFAEMPGWVQTAAGLVSEGLGSLGGALETAGKLSFSVVSIANAVKELNNTGLGAKLLQGGAALGKGALAVGGAAVAGYGLYELGKSIADISDSTDNVAGKLSGLKITIDEDSKNATLQAIAQVQAAADKLSGGDAEQYAGTSRVVQMGYGTAEMYGTALAWEQEKGKRAIAAVYEDFGRQINQAEAELIAAPDEAGRQAAQARIQSLTAEMEAAAGEQRSAMAQAVSSVINGAIQQTGATDALSGISEKYSLLDQILSAYGQVSAAGRDTLTEEVKAGLRSAMEAAGYDVSRMRLTEIWDAVTFREMAEYIWGQLAGDVEDVAKNGQLMSVLSTALSSGALDDAGQASGAVLSLLQAMDVKAIADAGVNNWKDIGKNSMAGLGQGIDENTDGPRTSAEAAAQGLTDAARAVLGVQSPSTVFYGIGLNIDAGLADGIIAGADQAIAAAQWLAGEIESTMRNALDIHSPSGVARLMGGYFAEGFAQGLENGVSRVEKSMDRLTRAVTPRLDGNGNPVSRQVHVTVNMDGKAMAQALAPLMDTALGDLSWDL